MKRLLFLLAIIAIISLSATYIFIPATLKVSSINIVAVNADAAFRILRNTANWKHFTGKDTARLFAINTQSFMYNNDTFAITDVLHNILRIRISNEDVAASSLLSILPIRKDTVVIRWESEVITGTNPINKIKRYRQAVSMKNNISDMMNSMQKYLRKQENVYGYKFEVTSTNDTLLVAIKGNYPGYPDVKDVYTNIKKLQQFVAAKGGKEVAAPMINITKASANDYQLMVALPVNKPLVSEGPFLNKKLIRGNFLVTEVKGGIYTIDQALETMQTYISEAGKTSMAIPFQMLITDREKQPDSTQWITKLYFPIVR